MDRARRGLATRYRSVLHRPDGVDVEFEGGSYNELGGRREVVQHDIAHLIVEDELALTCGVWGVLVAGAVCDALSLGWDRPIDPALAAVRRSRR